MTADAIERGDGRLLRADPSTERVWLSEGIEREAWTVGSLIPAGFDSYVRIDAPTDAADPWWDAYQSLFDSVLDVLAADSATAKAWFALWDGHPCHPALRAAPRLQLPMRTYRVFRGPVEAHSALEDPHGRWLNPDLIWPTTRRWMVATDVDFWSLYVGASQLASEMLLAKFEPDAEKVARDFIPPAEL